MESIFGVQCPECGSDLRAHHAWVWRCAVCSADFERCGQFVVTQGDRVVAGDRSSVGPSSPYDASAGSSHVNVDGPESITER